MRIKEIRELSGPELQSKVVETRREIVELRFQQAMRKLENPAKLRLARKKLSRLLTIETQKNN